MRSQTTYRVGDHRGSLTFHKALSPGVGGVGYRFEAYQVLDARQAQNCRASLLLTREQLLELIDDLQEMLND